MKSDAQSNQYAVEKELADKLRQAPREQRGRVYVWLQEELARRMPDHPSLSPPSQVENNKVNGEFRFIRRFLRRNATFLEIGPGDYKLVTTTAGYAARVVAVDIPSKASEEISLPANCQLILSDGQTVPVAKNSIDVAYSCELTEHLHPEDARHQVQDIYNALKPGGVYICITPNCLNGPHDGSRSFADISAGLHIREYTRKELAQLFLGAGFRKVRAYVGRGRFLFRVPIRAVTQCETWLEKLARRFRTPLTNTIAARAILAARLVAYK